MTYVSLARSAPPALFVALKRSPRLGDQVVGHRRPRVRGVVGGVERRRVQPGTGNGGLAAVHGAFEEPDEYALKLVECCCFGPTPPMEAVGTDWCAKFDP
jgi:hypothetical protein